MIPTLEDANTGTGAATLPPPVPAARAPAVEDPVEDEYGVSPMQEGMLFHALRNDVAEAYLLQYVLALGGEVDAAALRRAWETVVARHAVLRTSFAWNGGGAPRQRVHRAVDLPWETHDWRALPAYERAERLDALLAAARARGFDLARAPLIAVALVRTGSAEWRMAWTHHHLVLDGWSAPRVLGEVLACYAAEARGRPAALPAPRPYREYVEWAAARDLDAAEAFWREALAGFPAATPLAAARDTGETGQATVEARLPATLTAWLRSAARARGLTLNTLFQGAWALLLARYAGTDDVVFGATVSGRSAELEGVEERVGLFINTLPVRVRVPARGSAAEWLSGLQARAAAAREHEHAPLTQVQRWSEVPAGEPLFESLLVFENFPVEEGEGAWGFEVALEAVISRTHYPLTVTVLPGARMGVRIKHDRARFTTAAAKRMLSHLQTLLDALARMPEAPLASLPLLPAEERRQVVEGWNQTALDLPAGATVAALFAAQAARTPHADAVVCGGDRLTYAALAERAGQVARALRARGVGPETRVGIVTERSVELVAAILGVLRAGGAYVPVDPAHPDARIAFVLRDAGATAVLTQAHLADRIAPLGPGAIAVDRLPGIPVDDADGIDPVDAVDPAGPAGPDHLAHVIYTSGSTGEPKGVLVSNRSVVNLAFALREAIYERRDGEGAPRVSMNGPVTFDTSVKQLVQLCFGAAIHVVPEEVRADGAALAAWLRESAVDVFDCTPGQLRMLLEAGGLEGEGAPADVLVAGEAIDPALWARLAGDGRRRFHDLYGPTECTVDAALGRVAGREPRIGRPVANARAYVLDAWGFPAPIGVPGELYVGGAGVARGYLGRPAATAERFLPDPFAGAPGARLYRTGDRARWTDDGALEFLGRADDQVKIRGFRVEPGEVAAALRAHPGVRDAAVVAHVDGGDARLVAYVVAAGDDAPPDEALRAHLRGRLPEHMVPAAFVALDAIPLTRHGKVDRRALPAPGAAGSPSEAYEAPRTPAEEVLAAIWAEVLGAGRVGAHDDFFALGGHSLLAARVVARAREAFGCEVPLRALFEARTVAGLAAAIARGAEGEGAAAPPLRPIPRDGALPLSFAQARLWFLHQLEPESGAYHMPSALRLRGALDVDAFRRSLDALAARHEALRTTFAEADGEAVQRIAPPAPVALPVTDLRALPADEREAEVRRRARDEAARPFDLAAGPLLRVELLRTGDEEWVILFTLHHIVGDGWSSGVMIREMAALYDAHRAGAEPALAPLPVQYADYAAWQRAWLAGPALEAQARWWRARLAGAPPLLELPTDRPRPRVQGTRAAAVPVALPPAAAAALRALARREGATPFMALLAGWQALLARWSGQDDVCVGMPVAGRGRTELEGIVGFFANTLVLRAGLADDPSFRALLRRAREGVLEAHAHGDLPFEKLVDELEVERSLAHTPLFQAMLVVQGAGRNQPALGGRVLERLPREEEDAKFDLLLELEDGEAGIAGRLVYRAELWRPETMARLTAHLGALLTGAAAEPDRPVGTLALLDDDERRRVLVEPNDTARPLPAGESLHGLFEAQARRTPDAVALVAGEERIGYRALNERANRLARHLRALGVGTETRVGVCLGRTPSLVTAILAVLKAGGAYVPLDPAYPRARLALILEDAGAAVLLTESHLLERIPAHGGRTVCLDADTAAAALHPGGDLGVAVPPESLAYLIYTSGSTGRPKGVAIEHRSAAAFVRWGQASFPREVLEATLFSTSVCFDLSVFELFLPLAAGTRLVLAENALALPDLAAAGEVTLVNTVPSACAELLRMDGFPPSLRAVCLAGEPLPRALADGMAAREIPLFNLYGPSEYTTYATWTRVSPAEGSVSIGRPLANTRVYLLDRHGRLAPLGVAAELCLGGAGLARGYLGRPALTAERFVPDPFGPAGARLYRTGDRARWAADGGLEFLGRIDHQVKVRGFRVEPGEIEAVLLRHPGVREATVAVREEGGLGARLVAYVAARGEAPAAGELRAWVRERLPEFMVPHAFVFLPALPLTPSGKVDRKALPAPPAEAPAAAAPPAPRTPAEAALATIWAEVLERPRVGVDDNFFEAGGDSILSLRIVSRARKAGLRFTPRDLFEHPTVAGLAGLAVVDGAAGPGAAAPGFDAETEAEAARLRAADPEVEDVYPLTPLQEGLLLHSLSAPEGGAYVAQYAWELAGALDEDAFARSWDAVVARHAALRTAFLWEGRDRPLQAVYRGARMPLYRADWRGVPAEDLPGRLADWREDDRARGFELERAPLLRAALLRTADRAWTLVWTHHHLVLDGWSLPLVFGEVAACYAAALRGEAPSLPAPPAFRDFVAWLRRQDPARAEAFWRAALEGLGEPARLDAGRDRAPGEPEEGHGRRVLALTQDETERLRAFARRERLTLNTVVQGAWALLLARYAGGAGDVVFGATVSGRPAALPAAEETVGVFINTLPVRVRVAEGERVLPWLAGLQAAQARLREHEHTPLARVQQWSGAGDALFESVVAFENYPPGEALRGALPGVSVAAAASRMHTHYPFTLAVVPGRALELALTHARDRAGGPAAARLLEGVRTLLAGLATAGGETRLRGLALVDGVGRAALLAWSAAPRRAPYATVHALFAAQAARTPRRVALAAGEERLTYAELDARSSRLARRLRAHGVGPDVAVGIVAERGIGMVVALLAVLRAGGAYLPLDPSYPPGRMAAMLDDAGAPLVLAAARHRDAVPGGVPVVVLEEAEAAAAAEPAVAPEDGATPEHLAYLIYTSGSTGRPKGVAVPHRAIPGFFWEAEYARFDADQVLLQHSSTSWDALTLELWPALLTGGRCVLYPGASSDPAGVAAEVRRNGVTTLWLSAAYFNAIVDTLPEALDGVGQVMTGGEAVSAAHARRALERWPALRLVNGYGPSECTVFATCQPVAPGFAGSAVPIGAPVGDRTVHLLDGWMEPVPVGVVGEMYVGGPSVPRGYARRPALTAERLVPDPFGPPGARLYRTGDHARRLPDGTLEFVGRTDHQAKVRGFRVEPGEVEAVLREHPAVEEAAVLVRDDAPGGRALVAYAVRAPGADPAPGELLDYLSGRLPGYLVPAAAVVLGAFPLTAHRKLDRRALPAPAWGGGEGGAPATPAEAALAAVWAEVLGVEQVGTADNFFALGGDSILTFQVVARAARRGVAVTPRQLFEHPTVAALARVAGMERAAAAEQGPVVGEAPLTPIQHWFFAQEIEARDHWNQALLLRPRAPLAAAPLRAAVAALLAHHDALRLRFEQDGEGEWTQAFAAPGGEAPVSTHDLSALPAGARAAALEAEAARLHASLDLARGPLLRVARFLLGEDGERLLLVAHHLAVDGVSWRVLVEDLATACDAAVRGEPPRLPAKTTSFRAWAARLAEHAASAAMAAEAAAWLAPVPAGTPPLPVDFAGGGNRVERGAHLDAELDEETTRALLHDVPPVYHTQANDALLAALGRTLATWTGDGRVLVDLEGHGREPIFADVDLSRTVGWFTTLFPVALDLRGAEGPGEALVAAKERLRAVPNRGIGFGVLRWLSPDPAVRAALAALPAAGVAFNYLGQLDPAVSGDQAFALAEEGMGPLVHPSGSRRAHLLEVNAIVHGGRLRCRWEFATDVHRRETVAWLAGRFLDELRELVAHCRSAGAGRHTPSDFALAGIDAATLAMLEGDLLLQDEADEGS